MQVQDNRTKANAPTDPFSSARETQQSFARASSNGEFNLFADIFNSFAVSAPPASQPSSPPADIAGGETQSDSSPEPVSESTSSKDDEDTSDNEAYACGLACYALPVENQPVIANDGEAGASKDVSPEPSIDSTVDKANSPSHLVAENVTNSGKIDAPALGQAPVKQAANTETTSATVVAETPTEPVKVLATAPENAGDKIKAAKPSTEPAVADSQVDPQTAAKSDNSTELSAKPAVDESVLSDQTQAGAVTNESTQSDDRGDRRRRSSESDNRSASVDRQEANRDNVADVKTSHAPTASGSQEPSSAANSTGTGAADGITSVANQSSTQAALASVGSLASLPTQLSGSQRGSGGASTPGMQSVTGSPSTGGVNQSGSRSNEAAAAGSTASGSRTDVADRARLVHRIAKAFQKMGIDSGQVRLKMHPDELGGVQIEMQINGRSVKAKVIADGEEARQLLQDSLPELRQRLESQGLKVERLDVELRSENESSSLLNQNQQQQSSGFNDEASRRDGVWRRPAEARNTLNSVTVANPELRQTLRSVGSDRSLDLKV